MATRTADAEWRGPVPGGEGSVKLGSGAFEGHYSYASRFENGAGTNPEELLGAAHAACFSIALALILGGAGFEAHRIRTSAIVDIVKSDGGFKISTIKLITRGEVPGLGEAAFIAHAETAKRECPVSKALAGVAISLDAMLDEA